jgi:hypothetical protein
MKRVENSTKGEPRFQFNGKLITPLSETPMTYTNALGQVKNFKLCTVEYANQHGEIKQATASVAEGNYSKGELKVGTEYLCTATLSERDGKRVVYINMSHLVAGAGFADVNDFDFEEVETSVTRDMSTINS